MVRKVLKRNGYRWLPRSQKPKYDDAKMQERKAFADRVLKLSDAQLREKLSMSMDGVVLAVPPATEVRRINYCRASETHCWRKPSEKQCPELQGGDKYRKQVPLSRAIPLWGGISAGGFAPIVWHAKHKLDTDEWVEALQFGKLTQAIKDLKPVKRNGPWYVLCDNESFLLTEESQKEYRKAKVRLWRVPARSPDLNPVEKFWGWLRRELVRRDLKDLQAKRPVLKKPGYLKRVQAVCRSPRAQEVASKCAQNFRKACQQISGAGGAAAGG